MATNLTVHRNRVEARRKREVAKRLTTETAKMVRDADIRAYAVVGIAADGSAHAIWDTGAIMPMWGFPETVGAILRRDMDNLAPEEDWTPSLTPHGSK